MAPCKLLCHHSVPSVGVTDLSSHNSSTAHSSEFMLAHVFFVRGGVITHSLSSQTSFFGSRHAFLWWDHLLSIFRRSRNEYAFTASIFLVAFGADLKLYGHICSSLKDCQPQLRAGVWIVFLYPYISWSRQDNLHCSLSLEPMSPHKHEVLRWYNIKRDNSRSFERSIGHTWW